LSENPAHKAFDAFAAQYDHESDDWLDMDIRDFFEAGYAAGLERAASKLADWKNESERQGMPAARQRWENAELAIRYLIGR
jgi:hypothetical protein